MLLAEAHGYVLEAATGDENYLTSAVFGHLRYVPPQTFWSNFLNEAKSWPLESSLKEALAEQGVLVSEYSSLRIHFWAFHPEFGEPDLLLSFSGHALRPLVLLVEVKLWSDKSGSGDNDQLVKYAKLLNDLRNLNIASYMPEGPLTALLYLAPRDSTEEIRQSISLLASTPAHFLGLYRTKWQDLLVAIRYSIASAEGISRMVLQDVQLFLERRGLEYFNGFREASFPGGVDFQDAAFYDPVLFAQLPELELFPVQKGGWAQ